MNSADVRNRIAIARIGATEFSRASGRSELDLACEAILAAVADTGLRIEDIDGIVKYSVDTTGELPNVAWALGSPNLSFWALRSGAWHRLLRCDWPRRERYPRWAGTVCRMLPGAQR